MTNNKTVKNALLCETAAGVPDDEALELIAQFTRKTPQKDDIYTFSVILCDNEIDRDAERFSVSALNTLCEMFKGVTGIFDHSMKSSDQTARVYKTQVLTDETKLTAAGEKYTYLKAWCYMLKTAKNAELIKEIDAGIKKEVSVSCSCSEKICSVCGKSMYHSECNHIAGKEYAGKKCHAVLNSPTDAYEWSFVAVPAQRNAGVSKSAAPLKNAVTIAAVDPDEIIKSAYSAMGDVTLTKDQIKAFSKYLDTLKTDADAGKTARKTAEQSVVALAAFTLPTADTKMLCTLLEKLENDEVFMLSKAFEERAYQLGSFEQSLMTQKTKNFGDNSQFKI